MAISGILSRHTLFICSGGDLAVAERASVTAELVFLIGLFACGVFFLPLQYAADTWPLDLCVHVGSIQESCVACRYLHFTA